MATDKLQPVDPMIWRTCAGTSQIPLVGSRVYYFPQGHAEQSSGTPSFPPSVTSHPFIICHVFAVRFLANPETDEVFAKIHLDHINPSSDRHVNAVDEHEEESDVVSFAKVLTPSDANNGGGFSVPRFCADSIFPALNFDDDPPVQNLTLRDVHGVSWEFRHIYRGTPRRHLLTTGWSKFVNKKKLVAGDSVVFMKNRQSGELSVGIRRAVKANGDCNGRWNCYEERGEREREGFSRSVMGRVTPEAVVEAAELGAKGLRFEIEYYPMAGLADFVVKAEKVEHSFSVFWTVGMRIKIAMQAEDSSRMTLFQGTVASTTVPTGGPWSGSPWRMLQVTWDDPEVLQNMKRVSPWEVEFVVPTSSPNSEFPPTKKFRIPQDRGLLPGGEGELFFSMRGLNNSMLGHLTHPWMNCSSFPAGIQGARQEQICVSSVSNFRYEKSHQMCTGKFIGSMLPLLTTVPNELNAGTSLTDNSSPDSHINGHFFGKGLVGKRVCSVPPKVGMTSFQLFGKTIHMKDPVEGGSNDVEYREEDGRKVYKENEGVNSPHLSLSYPYTKLLDNIHIQCQSTSAV